MIIFNLKLQFLLFAIIFIAACACLKNINFHFNKRLIENLTQSLEKSSCKLSEIEERKTKVSIPKYYSHIEEFFYHLDEDSKKIFENISDNFRKEHLSQESIREYLYDFSPNLIFREFWMDQIMYIFISETFPGIKNIKDLLEFEALELVSIKLIQKKFVRSLLPEGTVYMLLCFMHEMIFGINETLPATKTQWIIKFAQNLFKRDMPRCGEYYLEIFKEKFKNISSISHENIDTINQNVSELINFLGKKPNHQELLKFYKDNLENNSDIQIYAPELIYTIINILHKCHLITANLITVPSKNDKLSKYILSRDLLNRFDISKIVGSNNNEDNAKNLENSITKLTELENPSVVQLDIFRQLIISCNFQNLNNSKLSDTIFTGATVFLKIFLTETSIINMFFRLFTHNEKYNHILFNSEKPIFYDNLEFFVNHLKSKSRDPLPLLFVNISHLKKVRHLILGEFNLYNTYKFEKLDFATEIIINNSMHYSLIKGKTLTFENLVSVLDVKGLIEIFTDKPLLKNNNSVNTETISLSKFIFEGVLEPIESKSKCSIS